MLVLAVASACAGGPQSFSRAGTMSIPDRYSCAMAKVNELGYTVANADRGAGLIRAQKESSGVVDEVVSGTHNFRVLTISIYEETESGNTQMRITASQREEGILDGAFSGGEESGQAPDDETKQAAREILNACTEARAGAEAGDDGKDEPGSGGPVIYTAG